jgi:pyruvate kinase
MRRQRNLKIVATLGPSSATSQDVRKLFDAGADVFRIDMAHGGREDHRELCRVVRLVEHEIGRPLGLLMDLQASKLRIGGFRQSGVELVTGQRFCFDQSPALGDHTRVCLPYPAIHSVLSEGDVLHLEQGRIVLRVESVADNTVYSRVLTGGLVEGGREIKLPNVRLPMSSLTGKDIDDLAFGLSMGVDWVALSLVQDEHDIAALRQQIGEAGKTRIIAKFERSEALQNLEKIVAAADAVMIVRDALSVELAMEEVPVTQRRIVRECLAQGKPVLAMTQMLESMVHHSTPAAAEANHVASAVYDGVDAIVLSSETAHGKYPVEAVAVINRVARRVEQDTACTQQVHGNYSLPVKVGSTEAISAAVRGTAELLPLCFIAAYTLSGATCLAIARVRPRSPILGLSPLIETARMLSLVWGVYPIHTADASSVERMLDDVYQAAQEAGFTQPERPFVIVAGMPFGTPGSTNLMRIAWT